VSVLAGRASRGTIVASVCAREWREALGNKLLVGMTLFPPIVILGAGVFAVAAAALYPPSEKDLRAIYAAAPAVAGLDPTEAVQGIIAQYFLVLFMLIPTVVPLTIAIYSVIGEKAARTLEPLLATPVGVGELLLAKSIASTIPAVVVTWIAYVIYLVSVVLLGSPAAVRAVTAPRWILAVVVMVPLLTALTEPRDPHLDARERRARRPADRRARRGPGRRARHRAGHGTRRARRLVVHPDDRVPDRRRSGRVLPREARLPAREHIDQMALTPTG